MANLCGSLENNSLGCDENNGGLGGETGRIYIFDWADIVTIEKDETTHYITKLDIGAAPKYFELVDDSGNYTDEMTSEPVNQSVQWTQTLNVQRNIRNAVNSLYFRQLTKGLRYLGIVIVDNNGEIQLMEKAKITAITDGSGTVRTDGSKYLATFTATNNTSMFFLHPESFADFIATGQFEYIAS